MIVRTRGDVKEFMNLQRRAKSEKNTGDANENEIPFPFETEASTEVSKYRSAMRFA